MSTEIDAFLSSHRFSTATKSTYRYVLERLTLEPFREWSASQLLNWVNKKSWGNSMQYVALCASKKFIAWACGAGHPALSARLKRVKSKKGRALDLRQCLDLLSSFDTSAPIGARDLALAALAIDTGLRASELARVQLADVDLSRRTLQVLVKGGAWSFAVFSDETAMYIDHWLAFRKPADGVGALFVSLRDNKTHGRALTRHGMKAIFKRWGKNLGITLSPHDARRTFGNVTAKLGAPTAVTMAAGRWESFESFRRYQQEITAQAITPWLPVTNALKPGVKP